MQNRLSGLDIHIFIHLLLNSSSVKWGEEIFLLSIWDTYSGEGWKKGC